MKSIIGTFLWVFLLLNCSPERVQKGFQAEKGVLDVRSESLGEEWMIPLTGEWEIYPGHFYYHEDFLEDSNKTFLNDPDFGYITNPRNWIEYKNKNGKAMHSFGYATQRLFIKLDRNYKKLSIRIPDIFSAYRLYIDGKLIASKGQVSVSEQGFEPSLGSRLVDFEPASSDVEIVLHISNFFHYRAGMVRSLELGSSDYTHINHTRKQFFDIIALGSILIVCLYNFGLYLSRLKDPTPLVFSLYCLGHIIRSGFTNERILLILFPEIPVEFAVQANFLVLSAAPFVTLWMFKYLFPEETNSKILVFAGILSILEIGSVLFANSLTFTSLSGVYDSIVLMVIVYVLFIIGLANKNNRIGSKTLFAGFLLLAMSGIHDLLLFRNIILDSFFYTPYAFLFFILCQAVVIARKTTYAIQYSEILSGNLEKSNKELMNLKDQLEFKVEQRTKELQSLMEVSEMEKAKSDRLLLNILPREVAEQLKDTGRVTPVHYESATVMFTDFKGFTKIAERLNPGELIFELDNCFTEFDKICRHYGLEKLKTIGDSYMCAAGLPSPKRTHAIDACIVAIAIREFMKGLKDTKIRAGSEFWELRIGIHSGPVVAGVIGQEKFAYDVWGDAVNMACRIEEAGEIGRINISGNTYQYIKEFFDCEYRGKVMAKNKGELDMYFVNRIRPEFSNDDDGIVPNFEFYDRYGDILYDEIKLVNS